MRLSIEFLKQFETSLAFKTILKQGDFESVYVDYETPYVERLWCQIDPEIRLFLHRISPCETALYHPHPWASVIRVLPIGGSYEMQVGTKDAVLATLEIKDSYYEMIDSNGFHSVRPTNLPVYSVMLTEKTDWLNEAPKPTKKLHPLKDEEKLSLLKEFRTFYKVR